MAATPQGMTQGFLQSAGNLQTTAQNNVPFSANNGNPYTIYNQTPQQGGYLPPVSNAYDQWRINPMQSYGGGMMNMGTGNMGGGSFPLVNLPNLNGGGGTLPVLPPNPNTGTPPVAPVTPPNVNTGNGTNPNMYTIGSGGWMLNGPTVLGMGGDNGSLNTSYTNAGFGLFGSGYNGMNTGTGGAGSNPFSGMNLGGTLGNIADFFLPGDAYQTAGWNLGNLGLGIAGQQSGLPLTWLASRLADTNWAQTSDGAIATWLRNWNESNDLEAMQQYYNDPANGTRGAMEGWLAGAYTPADPNAPLTPEEQQAQHNRAMALFNARATGRSAEDIYRREGVLGLQRAGYNPNQINAITGQGAGVNGGMGIGLHASGAFTPGMANVLQGDAARGAFAALVQAQQMQPTYQRHNNQF